MKKIAIFVEGQTELIFIREFILKIFEYQNVNIECRTLFSDSNFLKAEYDFPETPNDDAEYHFQIINVGNDNSVISRILKREKQMWNAGYIKIIGLRDMYSKAYREITRNIDENVINEFILTHQNTINQKTDNPNNISFCFAVMETEAWFLGFNRFEQIDIRLTNQYIMENLGFDLNSIDPEISFFHPAYIISQIYQLVGKDYDKHKGDIEAIAKKIMKNDYDDLYLKEKCKSFKEFYNILLLND